MTSARVPDDLVRNWLNRIAQEKLLGGGARRYALLTYLVIEELEGRGESLKAYAIALDALGRSTDFDPSTDSIVRVEVARLRDALALYYARTADADEPRILIPKGSYRPIITHPSPPEPDKVIAPNRRFRLNAFLAVSAVSVMGLLAFILTVFIGSEELVERPGRPIIEVASLTLDDRSETTLFAIGFRHQLLSDLTHLPTAVVRDGPVIPDALRSTSAPNPDYRLKIVPTFQGDVGIIGLQLTSVRDETILWAKSVSVSSNAEGFFGHLEEAITGIGQEIAGASGAITTDQARRSASQYQTGEQNSEYECLVVSLAYDATKEAEARQASTECLAAAVSAGTTNATLVALHALNLFFMSGEFGSSVDRDAILSSAAKHAQRATEIDPSDALSQEVLGNIQSALGDRLGAIASYAKAVKLAPSRPAPHFLLGWQRALQGDWNLGVIDMQNGIDMAPTVPGYMIIPLVLDAFRRSDYEMSLQRAKEVIRRGDPRGFSLAFAASIALGDEEAARKYFFDPAARTANDPIDPMREVRVTFSNPDVMPKYQEAVGPFIGRLGR